MSILNWGVVLSQFFIWNYSSIYFYLYSNQNKLFSRRSMFFLVFSSSCTMLFGFPSCCGVNLVLIEGSNIQSVIRESRLWIWRNDYSNHFNFIILLFAEILSLYNINLILWVCLHIHHLIFFTNIIILKLRK